MSSRIVRSEESKPKFLKSMINQKAINNIAEEENRELIKGDWLRIGTFDLISNAVGFDLIQE